MWETNRLTTQGILTLSVIPQQVALVSLTNGTSAIQFQTVQGRTYQLLSSTSLEPASSWMSLLTITGSNTVAFQTNTFLLTNGIVVTNVWYQNAPSTVVLPLVRTNPELFFRLRVY